MYFATTAVLAASAAFVAAQTKSDCAAQNIVEACLGTQMPQLQACAANDWDCMCTQAENVLTCYNNCPGDSRRTGQSQQRDSYCQAAKAYPSTSSTRTWASATGSATSTASPTLAAGVSPSVTAASTPSASSTVKPINGNSGSGAVGINVAGMLGAFMLALA